jgi:hypothetical protein
LSFIASIYLRSGELRAGEAPGESMVRIVKHYDHHLQQMLSIVFSDVNQNRSENRPKSTSKSPKSFDQIGYLAGWRLGKSRRGVLSQIGRLFKR